MPFFIPQISFLLGMQISLSRVGLDGTWLALMWVHMIFILPYTWLIVIPARQALDHRSIMWRPRLVPRGGNDLSEFICR